MDCITKERKRKSLKEKIDYNLIKTPKLTSIKLGNEFYNVDCYNLGTRLLGKVIVRKLSDSVVLKGRIVETECYLGGIDKASHSYGGRYFIFNNHFLSFLK